MWQGVLPQLSKVQVMNNRSRTVKELSSPSLNLNSNKYNHLLLNNRALVQFNRKKQEIIILCPYPGLKQTPYWVLVSVFCKIRISIVSH
jgi:sporulation protein YlmC with PRC-barrel domain